MASRTVTVVRIYTRESSHKLKDLMQLLRDEERVAGATVIRGFQGFGADGVMYSHGLVDLALDLPLILEFYDVPERVESVLDRLQEEVQIDHMISWNAVLYLPKGD